MLRLNSQTTADKVVIVGCLTGMGRFAESILSRILQGRRRAAGAADQSIPWLERLRATNPSVLGRTAATHNPLGKIPRHDGCEAGSLVMCKHVMWHLAKLTVSASLDDE